MVAKRGLTNRAIFHAPVWKSRLKHSITEFHSIHAILAAIGHRFIAKIEKKKKKTIADVRVWGDTRVWGDARVWGNARGDQKPETDFAPAPMTTSWNYFHSVGFLMLISIQRN